MLTLCLMAIDDGRLPLVASYSLNVNKNMDEVMSHEEAAGNKDTSFSMNTLRVLLPASL